MTQKTIDYYLSPQSPWTYLGHERFAQLAKAAGATINVLPVDLGRVFPVSGGLPLSKRAPQRQAYRLVELKRWSEHLGRPLNLKPTYFPVDGHDAAKLIIAVDGADGTDAAMKIAGAIMRGVWVEQRHIADPAVLQAMLVGDRLAGAPPRRLAVAGGARALRGRLAARHRGRRIRRAELHPRRRIVLGPGPARLPRAAPGPLSAATRGRVSGRVAPRPYLP